MIFYALFTISRTLLHVPYSSGFEIVAACVISHHESGLWRLEVVGLLNVFHVLHYTLALTLSSCFWVGVKMQMKMQIVFLLDVQHVPRVARAVEKKLEAAVDAILPCTRLLK